MKKKSGVSRLAVSQVGETQLVEKILSGFSGKGTGRTIVGPGDDAAVVRLGRDGRLVLTTDMLVEGTHFSLGWSYPEAVGFKAVAANLSDVAAMGGRPLGIVVSLGIPGALPVRGVDRIYRGIAGALSLFGGELLGGDTVRSKTLTVCVSAVGELVGNKPLLRSGARPGDVICVTGSLGASQMGLRLLKKYAETKLGPRSKVLASWSDRQARYFREKLPASLRRHGQACIAKHLMPKPRVAETRVLSSSRISAAIDLSDGLLIDVARVANASGVGLLLREEDVPISKSCRAVAESLGVPPRGVALSSGEEYEILFTVAPRKLRRVTRTLAARCGTDVTAVGNVVEKRKGAFVLDGRGGRNRLSEKGFEHF
jgi:thiamine-monophosphate kinase